MALLERKGDPARQQIASGYPSVSNMNTRYAFGVEEVTCLRELAGQVAEIAACPEMAAKARLWQRHNDLETDEPRP